MEFLLTIGIGINIFTLLQLVRSKNIYALPNKIGIAILTLWTLRFFFFYFKELEIALNYPITLSTDQNFFFLDAVLLWLYAKSLINRISFSIKLALHFLPFILGMFLSVLGVLITPKEVFIKNYQQTVASMQNFEFQASLGAIVFILIIIVISIIYFLKSIREVNNYNQSLLANLSNLKNLNAEWVINFHRLWIGLFILPLLIYFANYVYPIVNIEDVSVYLVFALVLLSFFFNSNILNQEYALASLFKEQEINKTKNISQNVDVSQLEQLYKTLKEQRYYEDETLSLQKLSTYLEMKPTELTDLIKLSEYENFYDLINSYRIDAVKQDLRSSSEQIIIIAYNNGFNSKSAFNKIFKEKTGLTPSAYRKSS